MKSKRILVIDDERIILKVIKEELTLEGYSVDLANDGNEGCAFFEKNTYDLVVLDNQMPKKNGLEVLSEIKRMRANVVVIMMTAYGSIDNAVEAMKLGAYDYLTKPFENSELVEKINQAFRLSERMEIKKSTSDVDTFIIGSSQCIMDIRKKISKIKDLESTILLTGDSGTGKGVMAREIHNLSHRSKKPFIHVNCAVLPPNLIESELFGHVRGAFTGASEDKVGKFELAKDGTIFLDEIGTLDHNLQAKLLTALQEKRFEKIGSGVQIPIRARIIAATNRNLEEAVNAHEFREDLYYRLNVIHIECPALRYHKEDIQELVTFFLDKFNKRMDKKIQRVSTAAMEILVNYKWPGNVRELENSIESALALADGNELSVHDLPLRIRKVTEKTENKPTEAGNLLEIREVQEIQDALKRNNGHREHTANELGISRRTLQYKIKKYNLK